MWNKGKEDVSHVMETSSETRRRTTGVLVLVPLLRRCCCASAAKKCVTLECACTANSPREKQVVKKKPKGGQTQIFPPAHLF